MYKVVVMGRESSIYVVTETMETRKRLKDLQKKAGNLVKRRFSRRRWTLLDKMDFLLFERSLAEWPSCLEDMCGGNGKMLEDLYSLFSLELPHNCHLRVSRLLKTYLIHYLSLDKFFYPPGGSIWRALQVELNEPADTQSVE